MTEGKQSGTDKSHSHPFHLAMRGMKSLQETLVQTHAKTHPFAPCGKWTERTEGTLGRDISPYVKSPFFSYCGKRNEVTWGKVGATIG